MDTIQSDMSLSIAARGVSGVEDSWMMRGRGFEGKAGEDLGRGVLEVLRSYGMWAASVRSTRLNR